MNYPLISEYVESIKYAEDNLGELEGLRPVMDANGNPCMSSGNFAVVFKMREEGSGKLYALKCFLREQEGRAESYAKIASELEYVSSGFLTSVRYLEKELFVDTRQTDEREFPVLLMDWVEGVPLDRHVRANIGNVYRLQLLAYQFGRLASWLGAQEFAHGDLKPDNILVREDGQLVLVDYDGMFVPAMRGERARELGSVDFRHPSRTVGMFDGSIDDFSLISILLSLKAIAIKPELLDRYGATDRLLLSVVDYREPGKSEVLREIQTLSGDVELSRLLGMFYIACAEGHLLRVSFNLLKLSDVGIWEKLPLLEEDIKEPFYWETCFTTDFDRYWVEGDVDERNIDEFGVEYSQDGMKLINASTDLRIYRIREGTKEIGESAFRGSRFLNDLTIPSSVEKIGFGAFKDCESLTHLVLPHSLKTIEDYVFEGCSSLQNLVFPACLESIGECAFMGCSFLCELNLPCGLKSIGSHAFADCESLTTLRLPDGLISIENYAFENCRSLCDLRLPSSLKNVGDNPFVGCDRLTIYNESSFFVVEDGILFDKDKCMVISCFDRFKTKYTIPDGVDSIGDSAFEDCKSLSQLVLPPSVKFIGGRVFYGCVALKFITVPRGMLKTFEKILRKD